MVCALALLTLIALPGCSSVKPLEIKISPVKQVPLSLPNVDLLTLDKVEWYVVNKENAEAVFKELEKKNYDQVIFGLTDKGYENISVNMAKILSLVRQQEAIIGAYKTYHKKQAETIDSHNTNQKEQQKKVKKADDESNKSFIGALKFWVPKK
jgi:hypothetical protein